MPTPSANLEIIKGSSFAYIVREDTAALAAVRRGTAAPFTYKAITGVSKAAPARVTCVGHGVPDQWKVAIESVLGMRQVNARYLPARSDDFRPATLVTTDTFDLNDIDASLFTTYTSGGYAKYYTPVSLSGYTARMMVRETNVSTGTPLISLTDASGIALSDTTKTVTLSMTAAATAALTFTSGVFDLEIISGGGTVYKLLAGNVSVTEEVTRS